MERMKELSLLLLVHPDSLPAGNGTSRLLHSYTESETLVLGIQLTCLFVCLFLIMENNGMIC